MANTSFVYARIKKILKCKLQKNCEKVLQSFFKCVMLVFERTKCI